jgi:hypothetical protein
MMQTGFEIHSRAGCSIARLRSQGYTIKPRHSISSRLPAGQQQPKSGEGEEMAHAQCVGGEHTGVDASSKRQVRCRYARKQRGKPTVTHRIAQGRGTEMHADLQKKKTRIREQK